MAKLTQNQLKRILTQRLTLNQPQYFLENTGGRIVGHVVSASFKGKSDHERQAMIWDALDGALGADSVVLVGMLLAYTPEEWNLGADGKPTTTKRRKVG